MILAILMILQQWERPVEVDRGSDSFLQGLCEREQGLELLTLEGVREAEQSVLLLRRSRDHGRTWEHRWGLTIDVKVALSFQYFDGRLELAYRKNHAVSFHSVDRERGTILQSARIESDCIPLFLSGHGSQRYIFAAVDSEDRPVLNLFRSSDAGRSWHSADLPRIELETFRYCVLPYQNGAEIHVLVGGRSRSSIEHYQSGDQGHTWSKEIIRTRELYGDLIPLAVDFDGDQGCLLFGSLWEGSLGDVYSMGSSDHGQTWRNTGKVARMGVPWGVQVSVRGDRIIASFTTQWKWSRGGNQDLWLSSAFYSSDGGKQWIDMDVDDGLALGPKGIACVIPRSGRDVHVALICQTTSQYGETTCFTLTRRWGLPGAPGQPLSPEEQEVILDAIRQLESEVLDERARAWWTLRTLDPKAIPFLRLQMAGMKDDSFLRREISSAICKITPRWWQGD